MWKYISMIAITLIFIIGNTGSANAYKEHSRDYSEGEVISPLPVEVQPYVRDYVVVAWYYSKKNKRVLLLQHKRVVGQMAWAVFSFDGYGQSGEPINLRLSKFIILNKDGLYTELIWRADAT